MVDFQPWRSIPWVFLRRTPHPVIGTIKDSKEYIRVLLYSYYTTITGWGVLLRYFRLFVTAPSTQFYCCKGLRGVDNWALSLVVTRLLLPMDLQVGGFDASRGG